MLGEINEACAPFDCNRILGVAAVIEFGLTRAPQRELHVSRLVDWYRR